VTAYTASDTPIAYQLAKPYDTGLTYWALAIHAITRKIVVTVLYVVNALGRTA
jgi:hypothetical protein